MPRAGFLLEERLVDDEVAALGLSSILRSYRMSSSSQDEQGLQQVSLGGRCSAMMRPSRWHLGYCS